jgi:acyl-CoA synthetase (AMP-forming)/AMP-acid ligase II
MNEVMMQRDTMLGRATIGDQLRRHAQHIPEKPAIIFYHPSGERQVYSYSKLNTMVNRFAGALVGYGVQRGDVVAVMSRNSPDYVITYFAALKLGAAITGINFTFTPREINYQVNHSEPKVLVVEDVFAVKVAEAAADLPSVSTYVLSDVNGAKGPEDWPRFSDLVADGIPASEPEGDVCENDIALLQYTSGTEAFPKGVMIPHRNYLISTTPAWQAEVGISTDEVFLFLMPFFAIAGIGSMTTLMLLGATLIMVHAIDAPRALKIIEDEGVTITAQTPTFYLQMTQVDGFTDANMTSLSRCITYGGTVPQAMIDGWRAMKPDILWGTYWGQSELTQLGSVGWFQTLDDVPDGDPTWIGRPVAQLEIRVVDEEGEDAEVGELICRSPSAMVGYYKDAQKTKEVFQDGWLHTGDLVRIDTEGNLFFFDRRKDMIKTGGMNVSSQEVERVLYSFPGLLQVAVVGVADEYWSEAVTAFVVPNEDVTIDPDEVIQHCKSEMAGYKVPKAVHVVEELPKDTQGKILKRELRKMAG